MNWVVRILAVTDNGKDWESPEQIRQIVDDDTLLGGVSKYRAGLHDAEFARVLLFHVVFNLCFAGDVWDVAVLVTLGVRCVDISLHTRLLRTIHQFLGIVYHRVPRYLEVIKSHPVRGHKKLTSFQSFGNQLGLLESVRVRHDFQALFFKWIRQFSVVKIDYS